MGFLDILTGRRKLAQPAEDRLFAISTAYVTFETGLEITTRGSAAIVFQSLATADFTTIVRDMEEVVRATASDSATTVEKSADSYGFSWLILRGSDFDEPRRRHQRGVGRPAGRRLRRPPAVLGVRLPGRPQQRALYWIYNYKRGFFYPFVPTGAQQRDNERELVLKAQAANELPIEPELSRWFPLWGIPV